MRLEVVAACIEQDGRFLLCRRPAGKNCGGMWEFAGGKIEPGETGEQALVRECREELGVELSVGRMLAETVHTYPACTVHLMLYAARIRGGTLTIYEHTEARWVNFAQAEQMALCPADRALLAQIMK